MFSSIVRILTSLCWCCLGAKNLYLLILLIKNWPDDPCVGLEDVERFEELEEGLLNVLAFEFPKAIECYIEECQNDWETFVWFLDFVFWILDIHFHTTHLWVFLACLFFFLHMQAFFYMNYIFPKKNQQFILIYMVLHGFTWWTSVNHIHLRLSGFTWFKINLHDFALTLTWCVF